MSHPAGTGLPFGLKPLMFEIFVCSMAMMVFVTLAGPIARVIGLAPWQIGMAMTIAGVGWMIMGRVWGRLSDIHGRRTILLISLTGFALAYFLLALFIDLALRTAMTPLLAFVGLVAGRGISGLFYAAVPPTATALVADHVGPRGRAGAMAAIGASSAAGMVIGPGLAGLAAPVSLSLPLYITAILPVAGLVILWRFLPPDAPRTAAPKRPPGLFDRRLRAPMAMAFVAMFSVSIAQIAAGFFALDRLGLDPAGAAFASGVALALVGVALICAQTILRRLEWPPARLIRIGAALGGIGFGSAMVAVNQPMLWTSHAVAAFGMGWVYPSVSALAANSVEAQEQGAAAGAISAAQGLGTIIGPIAGMGIYSIWNGAPYALIGLLLGGAALWPWKTAMEPDRTGPLPGNRPDRI